MQCHGPDGNTPSLATVRAFGTQKLKFGADPYSMFKTLSHGNGLMAATTALSPQERYAVIGFIRNRFMKDSNPDYQLVTDEYLKSLPKGKDMGEFKPDPDRDNGPALASQLGRNVNSALSVDLGNATIAYDLHTIDQAGIWTGGFYGYVQNKRGGTWAPDGGRIDIKNVLIPETFDPPLIWMPQEVDNSSGGQVFVDDERWGPLSGRLLHTSFGQGSLLYLLMQEIDGVEQAALVKFPHAFDTGIMRGRVNPIDGQLFVTGLNGWNDNGRAGLEDNGIFRVRYTGKSYRMIDNCQVEPGGLRIEFNFPLDPASATDATSYAIEQWDYRWTGAYGSAHYRSDSGEVGEQPVAISKVRLSEDRKTVSLRIPNLQPVDQLHLQIKVNDESGSAFSDDVYWTIHKFAPGESSARSRN